MANTITKTTLNDGPRNLIMLVSILGDGSGDETNTLLVDRSLFVPTDGLELVVERIEGAQGDFQITLSFDATTDLVLARLPNLTWYDHDWREFGGLSSNKAGAGSIGDILLTTSGLGSGEVGTFCLQMRKT